MNEITMTEISVMDEVVPSLRCLHLALEMFQREYGVAAVIASKAWIEFDEAIDAGKPHDEINRLGDIAELADKLTLLARDALDGAKAALIARAQ